MQIAIIPETKMAKEKKTTKDKGRVEFKAPDSWILRAEKMAESIGLSLSAYIRLLVTEDMDRRQREKQNDK